MNSLCSVRLQRRNDEVLSALAHIECMLNQAEDDESCAPAAVASCIGRVEDEIETEGLELRCELDGDNVSHVQSCSAVTVEDWERCLDAQVAVLASFSKGTCESFEQLEGGLEQTPSDCQAIFSKCPELTEVDIIRVVEVERPQS